MKRIGYIAAQRIKCLKGQHIEWQTEDDDKQIRLNSRNYTITAGEQQAVRSWPRISVGGVAGAGPALVSFDARPGINDGIHGSHLISYRSDLYFKGSSGRLAYIAAGFDGNASDENVGGRTFSDDIIVGSRLWHQLHGGHTFTGHVVGFLARNAGGGKAWDALLKFEGDQHGAWNKAPGTEPTTPDGYIKVLFGATSRWIQLYSGAPVD